jgi:uncharacterized protein with PQ loop repeat
MFKSKKNRLTYSDLLHFQHHQFNSSTPKLMVSPSSVISSSHSSTHGFIPTISSNPRHFPIVVPPSSYFSNSNSSSTPSSSVQYLRLQFPMISSFFQTTTRTKKSKSLSIDFYILIKTRLPYWLLHGSVLPFFVRFSFQSTSRTVTPYPTSSFSIPCFTR